MKLYCLIVLFSFSLLAQERGYLSRAEVMKSSGLTQEMFDSLLNVIGRDDRLEINSDMRIAKSIGLLEYSKSLGQNMTEKSRCSATLIAPNYIITAAHCVYSSNEIIDPSFLKFLPSHNLINIERDFYQAKSIFVDPDYDDLIEKCRDDIVSQGRDIKYSSCPNWLKHDWAVIRLEKLVDMELYSIVKFAFHQKMGKTQQINLAGYPFDKVIHQKVTKSLMRDGKKSLFVEYINIAPPFISRGAAMVDYNAEFSQIMTFADMAKGMSGGPILNKKGRIIGVISQMTKVSALGQTLNKLNMGALIGLGAKKLICEWSQGFGEEVACK